MIPLHTAEERLITSHHLADQNGAFDAFDARHPNEFYYGACSFKFLMRWYTQKLGGLNSVLHWSFRTCNDFIYVATWASNELFTWWEDSGVFLHDNVWEFFNNPYEPKSKNFYFHFRYVGLGDAEQQLLKFRSPTTCLFPPCGAEYSPLHHQPKFEDLEYQLPIKVPGFHNIAKAARLEHTCPDCGFQWGMITS